MIKENKKLKKGFVFNMTWIDVLSTLEDKDVYGTPNGSVTKVLNLIKNLYEDGLTPENMNISLNTFEKIVYNTIASDVKEQRVEFLIRCEKAQNSANKRWSKQQAKLKGEKNEN